MIFVRVVAPFALGYFLSYLLRVVNAVIAPDLVRDIGLDAAGLGLLTSAYFLSFAGFQLPLGILLDRYGARRTEATLLLFAAAGAVVFALAGSAFGLVVGRALIGLGVCACLMAAFKAFVVWFPPHRLPTINGIHLAVGGLGALSGTAPVEWALGFADWRGLFWAFAVLTVSVAALIFAVVPEHRETAPPAAFAAEVRGVRRVFASPAFWRIAPLTVGSQAAFLSVQSLWAGPWLRDVAGLSRAEVADHLLAMAAAMIAGFLLGGVVAERLGRLGVRPIAVAVAGMVVFVVVQAAIAVEAAASPLWLWAAFGFFGTGGIIVYPGLSRLFPKELAGRVNTALNLVVFLAAFAGQWGIGAIIDQWPATAGGGYAPAGYRAAFGLLIAFQLAGLAWLAFARRWSVRDSSPSIRQPSDLA